MPIEGVQQNAASCKYVHIYVFCLWLEVRRISNRVCLSACVGMHCADLSKRNISLHFYVYPKMTPNIFFSWRDRKGKEASRCYIQEHLVATYKSIPLLHTWARCILHCAQRTCEGWQDRSPRTCQKIQPSYTCNFCMLNLPCPSGIHSCNFVT